MTGGARADSDPQRTKCLSARRWEDKLFLEGGSVFDCAICWMRFVDVIVRYVVGCLFEVERFAAVC